MRYSERAMKEVELYIQIKRLPEGVYLATSPDLPGFLAQGRTRTETIEFAKDIAEKMVESYREHLDQVPSSLYNSKRRPNSVGIRVRL